MKKALLFKKKEAKNFYGFAQGHDAANAPGQKS
jgi:hypothetical protein